MTADWTHNAGSNAAKAIMKPTAAGADRDVLAALAGKRAARECAVAQKARRVVMASFGVMEEQKAGRRRTRALALAALVVVLLALGPFVWHVTEDLIGGEQMADIATQTSLWICILCPAVLGAVIVAGWARSRQ